MENLKKQKLNFFIIIFFLFYIILPSYCAIEISSSLPLITASRIILIFLIVSYIFKNKGKINLKIFSSRKDSKLFKLYFAFLIIANLFYIFSNSDSLKQILTIILEELGVIWIITKVIDTKEKIIKALNLLVLSSGIVAIISIIGSITGDNFFYMLNTVNREMLMSKYLRLGFIRAEAGFGHPVYYGAYCLCMIPIVMYFIENTPNSFKYIIIFILNILGIVFSNSRGSILILVIMLLYMFWKKKTVKMKKYLSILVIAAIMVIFVLLIKPELFSFFGNIITSITNIFSTNQVELNDYGGNSKGLESRISQLSQIVWTAKHNIIFGLGAAAQTKGILKWYNPEVEAWQISKTFDVGYFSVICEYGIIGGFAFCCLYFMILRTIFAKNKIKKKDALMECFKYVFVGYFLLLLSIIGIHETFWVLLGLLLSYKNILKNEEIENVGGKII